MSLACIFGHRWALLSVQHYIDTSYNGRADSTKSRWICERCRKTKYELHYNCGFIDAETLTGVPTQREFRPKVIDGGKK